MPLAPPSSAIHLQPAPSSSAALARAPTSVHLHPAALFSILDHYLRRPEGQQRVIGTLLGTRVEGSDAVDVRAAFAVLHSETDEQVAVDMEYHQAMFELSQRVSPKDSIVGWYSTGSELNTNSALIQNFYAQETAPAPALHLVVDTGVAEGSAPGVRAYVSAPIGVASKPENALFVPVPVELGATTPEQAGIAYLTQPGTKEPITDLALLEGSLDEVLAMLDRVITYVAKVVAGEEKGDPALGRYLMDAFGTAAEELDKGAFANSLQDTLMLSYLANLARAQAEVASRLALVSQA